MTVGADETGEVGGLGPVAAALRWGEMLGLFFGVPAFVAVLIDPWGWFGPWFEVLGVGAVYDAGQEIARALIPLLLVFTAVVTVVLVRDKTFDNRRLWGWGACRRDLRRILGLFAVGAVVMLAVAWWLDAFTDVLVFPRRDGSWTSSFLRLPREAPWVLVVIGVFYPWLSAYPQEIVYRAFFFHRYGRLFRRGWALFAVNVAAFVWMHIPFWNVEALVLTLPGGVLFAWTYLRTKSTLAAGLEHALYGWWAFFTGLGGFVFVGSIGR